MKMDKAISITLDERDKELERLLGEFTDVPMDPETECMDAPYLEFPTGTHREEIWHWFDARHSKGVAYLLQGEEVDRKKAARLVALDDLCDDCTSGSCCYNCRGSCRFPLIGERAPKFTEEDGCVDYELIRNAKHYQPSAGQE